MNHYQESKEFKLKNNAGLRITNSLGMIAWKYTSYAMPKIRLLHPLSWFYIIGVIIVGCIMEGVPATFENFGDNLADETVWW